MRATARPLVVVAFSLAFSLVGARPAGAIPALREPGGGELPDAARAAIRAALTEEVDLLGGRALAPRPAADAKARLEEVARTWPQVAGVQRSLAQAAHAAGDPATAERAYEQAVVLSGGAEWALDDLAGFYEARGEVARQVATLEKLAAKLAAATKRPGGNGRRAELRRVYERIVAALGVKRVASPERYRRALVDLDPDDTWALRRYVDELVRARDEAGVRRAVATYLPKRPQDAVYLAKVLADQLESRRDLDGAVAVYQKQLAKDPVPADARRLYGDYLDLLDRNLRLRPLRRQLELKARTTLLRGVELATLTFILVREGKPGPARALVERARNEDREVTPPELMARARLAAAVGGRESQIAFLYAAAQRGKGALREQALAELAATLFGSETRSALTPRAPLDAFDLEKLDSGPSIIGGLASLLFLGGHGTPGQLDRVQAGLGNGQRALAVLAELRTVAPRGRATRELLARAVQLHRGYQLHREAAAWGEDFLRTFPGAPEAVDVGLLTADSYARAGQRPTAEKLYRRLLDQAQRRGDDAAHRRVLEAYVDGLTAEKRDLDAVKVFYAEVKRRPGDLPLLDRFLTYLERRNLYDDELRVYREAAKRFGAAGFYARIARLYLRQRKVQEFRELSASLTRSLGDQELLRYLDQTGSAALVGSDRERVSFQRQRDALYRALYRQALDRFPLEPRFLRRVLDSLNQRVAAEAAERERLTLRYAVLDAGTADEFVRGRAARGLLERDLVALAGGRNTAERILYARALTNRSRHEEALVAAARLLTDFPGDREAVKHVAELRNSLGKPTTAEAARAAVKTLDGYLALYPADEALVTRVGDLLAEAGLIDEARTRYEAIVKLRPADPAAHLRLATVYWDYYLFDLAAASIERVRRLQKDPDLYAEKLAAVHESAKQRRAAVKEYVRISWTRLDRTLGVGSFTRRGIPGAEAGEGEEHGEGGEDEAMGRGEEGAGEAPDAVRQRSPLAEQVTDRLIYLARRHQLRGAIDDAFRGAMKAGRGDARPAVAYARYLVAADRKAEARKVWLGAVAAYQDRFLLERAVAEGRGFGVPGSEIVIAALRRLALLAGGAPEQVHALAAALEAAGQADAAAREEQELLARLRGGAALEAGEIAGAELKLADIFGRARRTSDALAARARAAAALPRGAAGVAGPREEIELQLADERAAAGQAAEATALYAALEAQLPADPRPIVAAAGVRWRRGERDAAVAQLKDAIARGRTLPAAGRAAFVGGLRLALIARLAELGRHVEVVDQQLELINREPTRRDLVDRVITYARTHGGLDGRMLDFYAKTAQRSSKDHRWPVVLAWIYERRGQPAEAAREYGRALDIAPGRLDLAQGQAQAYRAAAQWAEAAQAYKRLYALSDKDRSYLGRAAEMLGRAGQAEAVRREVREMVRGSDRAADYVAAALLLERLGMLADAQGYAESALGVVVELPRQRSLGADGAEVYARLAVRTGLTGRAYQRLLDAARTVKEDSERKGNLQAWHERSLVGILQRTHDDLLPRAVAEYGVESDRAALRQALLARAPHATTWELQGTLARSAQAAGLPDLELDLYRVGLGRDPERGRFARTIWNLLSGRRDFTDLQAFLERNGDFGGVERAARLAEAYRQTGDEAGETRALKVHFDELVAEGQRQRLGTFATWNPLVERYLQLLRRQRQRDELKRVAATRGSCSAQVADFLLREGERDLALTAIDAAADGQPPVWLDVKRATAQSALGDQGPLVREPMLRALGVRPIGQKVGRKPDLGRELVSARNYRTMARYGAMVAGAEPGDVVARFLQALVEQRPRDPAAYAQMGDRLLKLKDPRRAEAAYVLALQLRPASNDYLDRRAQAVLAAGDQPRALARWREIIDRKTATPADHQFHAQALARAGLRREAREAFAPYVASAAPRATDDVLLGMLQALKPLHDGAAAGSAWDRYLGALLLRGERLPVLAAAAGVTGAPGSALVDAPARGPYLERGLQLLQKTTDAAVRWQWRQRHLDWLVETGRDAEVRTQVAALLPQTQPGSALRASLLVTRERLALQGGDARGAAARLIALAREAEGKALFDAALALFREAGREREAAEVAAALHAAQLEAGREDRGTLLGLADALLKLGRQEEALVHLGCLIVREPDDAESLGATAELLERHSRWADARGARTVLLQLRLDDAVNRVRLARDEIHAGLPERGVERAAAILDERGAARRARDLAADVLVDAAKGDGRAAARLAARVGRGRGDEAHAVAFARLRRVLERGDEEARATLARATTQNAAPGSALLLLGDIATARGRFADAARFIERAEYYRGASAETRRALFWARRGAGRHDAALLALDDDPVREFVGALPSLLLGGGPLDEAARAAAAALAAGGGDPVTLAPAAVDSARRAGDEPRALYYALAWAHATRGKPDAAQATAQGQELRQRLTRQQEQARARHLTASLDDDGPETPAARVVPARRQWPGVPSTRGRRF
jgi:tetratricopeptide (TPR) repeat protein